MSLTIQAMWAWVTVDDAGDEGVIAVEMGGTWFPAVGADRKRVESLRPLVADIIAKTGATVRLLRFTTREALEELGPPTRGSA